VAIVRARAVPLGTERVPLEACWNRVLLEAVASDMDMPPFDKSAVDGYACRREDLGEPLEVIEIVAAGRVPQLDIGRGQCSKVMTGAMIPRGADYVVMLEKVEEAGQKRIRLTGELTTPGICRRGEDVRAGQALLSPGIRISAKEVAALALAGCVRPCVSRKPRVGIITTGDEIVEPDARPGPSQIRNSNASQLMAQCLQFGAEPSYFGIVGDAGDAIAAALGKAEPANDAILVSGGVSMGDFDLVPGILRRLGYELHFEKVAIQPGKPTVFGRRGTKFVFGLPGNPVSSFTVFELLVKELLAGMMGLRNHARQVKAALACAVKRRSLERRAWIPVRMTQDGCAEPVEYHGSAHITSLAAADGLISIPVGVLEIPGGSIVDVRQI
jgi:molybdopterin molybdotransferase